jgi:hypothetical protein
LVRSMRLTAPPGKPLAAASGAGRSGKQPAGARPPSAGRPGPGVNRMAAGPSAGRLRPPVGHARRNRMARRERGERDACDRGRRGKWRIDCRVERSAARKLVSDQHQVTSRPKSAFTQSGRMLMIGRHASKTPHMGQVISGAVWIHANAATARLAKTDLISRSVGKSEQAAPTSCVMASCAFASHRAQRRC